MESVLRAALVYAILLVVFRIAGNRSIGQLTAFDFILLLIISESIEKAMTTNDQSLTNAFLIVITLVGIDIMLSLWKQRSPRAERILDGIPVIVMRGGKLLDDRMKMERVDKDDILVAARERQGLASLDQIEHAVVEAHGGISIIPKEKS